MPRYRRMTFEDRCQIRALLEIQASKTEIAQRLGFHKSTITREIKRNSEQQIYKAKLANDLARYRFTRCRRKKLLQGLFLKKVIQKITEGWSPEQISGRYAEENFARISHETIYRFIRLNHHLKPEFEQGLRKYKKRGASRIRTKKLRELQNLSIRFRPPIINNRERLGDWERDTMHAQKKKVIVCIERRSRFIKIARVQEPYCIHLTNQTKQLLRSTNAPVLSITNDNGTEFFDSNQFDVPVYYCDPRSPQQRGTVENSIGLLRQYIPRKTELDNVTDADLQLYEDRLNHRPRKILGYKTPFEILYGKNVALVC